MAPQVRLDVIPVQRYVDHNQDKKGNGRPVMQILQNVPERQPYALATAISSRQQQPVYQTGHGQDAQKNESEHVDSPQFGGTTSGHETLPIVCVGLSYHFEHAF